MYFDISCARAGLFSNDRLLAEIPTHTTRQQYSTFFDTRFTSSRRLQFPAASHATVASQRRLRRDRDVLCLSVHFDRITYFDATSATPMRQN